MNKRPEFARVSFCYCIIILCCLGFCNSLLAQYVPANYTQLPADGKHNFVRSYTVLRPGMSATAITGSTNPQEVQLATQYFDGLGRPIQTVVRQGSLNSAGGQTTAVDLVSPQDYDQFGREQYQFLPYPSSESNGNFKGSVHPVVNPFQQQADFYNNPNTALNPIANQGNTYFYSKTNFEPSPLNRPLETFAPGNSWVGSEAEPTKRSVKMGYFINTATDAVRIWNVTDPAPTVTFGSYTSTASYPAGELYKNITTDEHGKQVIEFKDKSGQVILKKVQIGTATDPGTGADHSPANWICTYYIYDDFGSLRCVIQPEGVKWLNANSWNLGNASILAEQCFRYEYDERRRMIAKKVPGAGHVFMVYDLYDRLLLTQDANQRLQGKWLLTKYDALNRPVLTAIYTYSGTIAQARTLANTDINQRFETFIATDPEKIFYTKNCRPQSNYEVLTATYYDNYNWVINLGDWRFLADGKMRQDHLNDGFYFVLASGTNIAPDYVQPMVADYNVKGMVTGTRVRELGSNTFQSSATYYDEYGRAIQNLTTVNGNGYVWSYTQYDFAGRMRRVMQKTYLDGNGQVHYVGTNYEYDAIGRLSITKKSVNSGAYVSTAAIRYDALGQVKRKDLGQKRDVITSGNPYTSSPMESLQYDYNIRGWLLGVNRDFLAPSVAALPGSSKWFGFELGYDSASHTAGGSFWAGNQYNGNIQGQVWRSVGDGVQRQYHYNYDAANRLLTAFYVQRNADGSWNNSAMDFSFWTDHSGAGSATAAYDLNGNILQFGHRGFKPGATTYSDRNIDVLIYSYQPLSNKLSAVMDWISTPQNLGDFTDKNVGSDDYGYDPNGNLITDLNKRLNGATGADLNSGGAIAYNHLNLPTLINVKKDDGSAKGTIAYTYDATGNKLRKVTVDQTTAGKTITTTTHYTAGMVLESRTTTPADANNPDYSHRLQFMGHEEGRIRSLYANTGSPNTITGYAYDYMLKDHLGNVRMVLTDEIKSDLYPALSFEGAANSPQINTQNATWEKATGQAFDVVASRTTQANLQNYAGTPAPGTHSLLVRSSTGKVGAAKMIKVQAGDKIHSTVQYYYPTVGSNPAGNGINTLTAGLAAAIANSLAPVAAIKGGASILTSGVSADPAAASFFTNQNNNAAPSRPRAYLNVLFFDEQFTFDASSSYSEQVGAANPGQIFVALNPGAKLARKSGYCYIYISNETDNLVFFDNLTLTHERGPLLEETHYYPFGLTMAGISSKAAGKLENKFKYNGKELQSHEFSDGTGLELYDYGARMQDPQIGRWWVQDKFAEVYVALNPYQYAANNPIKIVDEAGHVLRDSKGNIIATSNGTTTVSIPFETGLGGRRVSISYKMEDITIYTDKGTPIHAQRAVEAYVTEVDEKSNPIGATSTKPASTYSGLNSNCFGYALADGNVWITDGESIKQLLYDEYTELPTGKKGKFSVIYWNNSEEGGEPVHAAKNNPDGTYDQDDAERRVNTKAGESEFWGEKRRDPSQNPSVSQFNRNSKDHKQFTGSYKPLPKLSFNGVNIVDQKEIERILKTLGLL